jgi:hypothetical protein
VIDAWEANQWREVRRIGCATRRVAVGRVCGSRRLGENKVLELWKAGETYVCGEGSAWCKD